MIPKRKDIEILRGVGVDFEIFAQKKVYGYDPDQHTGAGDLARSYAENLEWYGYTYEFIDFTTDYDRAELIMYRPYKGNDAPELAKYTNEDGYIILGERSVRVLLPSIITDDIDFNEATFKLFLIKKEVLSQQDQNAGIDPADVIDPFVYGNVVVKGLRSE